jgi:hypothetical protein
MSSSKIDIEDEECIFIRKQGFDTSGIRLVLVSITILGIFLANKFGYISLDI